MNAASGVLADLLVRNGLVTAFAVVGATMWASYQLSARLTRGRLHGSAIAIMLGLLMAYLGGVLTGGRNGIADFKLLGGIGLMGGAMLRDFAIVSTAYGATLADMRKCGASGIVSLFAGVLFSFAIGGAVAMAFGYDDAVSIAADLVKSVLVMVGTPLFAKYVGLDNPRTAMVFGGMMGTTSGVCGGLAALDPKLVPYGAMTSTFYTGLGCLMGPSVLFFATRAIVG